MNKVIPSANTRQNIKLSYFDFSGSRGEECRLAFFIAGVEFEDNRIGFKDWASIKPTTPYGEVPMLEIEGEGTLAQSNAILWLIGTRYGLLPDNEFKALQHLALMNAVEDLSVRISDTMPLPDEAKKSKRQALVNDYMKAWTINVEKQIQGSFVAGSKISIADIKIFILVNWIKGGDLDHFPTDFFDSYPKITRLFNAVLEHPKVIRWYEMAH